MSHHRSHGISTSKRALLACAALSLAGVAPVASQEAQSPQTGPRDLFSTPLPDVPGTHLEVVELVFAPKSGPPSTLDNYPGQGHHHPGSVYVHVTQGAIRIGVAGQPVAVVEAGGSFFEPPRAHHLFTESASATEGARAIAVLLVPDGEPSLIQGKSE